MRSIPSIISAFRTSKTSPLESETERPGGGSIETTRNKKKRFYVFKSKGDRALGVSPVLTTPLMPEVHSAQGDVQKSMER